jgi:hypothetical protein
MDILKQAKLYIAVSVITITLMSCAEPQIRRYDYAHQVLAIENWNIKDDNISSAKLYCYERNSAFNELLFVSYVDTIIDRYDSHGWTSLRFHFLTDIKTNKDYKLNINDTIEYKISNIKTTYIMSYQMPISKDSVYNMIKSIKINNKTYNYDEPKILMIPK